MLRTEIQAQHLTGELHSASHHRTGGVVDISKVSSEQLVELLQNCKDRITFLLPDGSAHSISRAQLNAIRTSIQALNSSELSFLKRNSALPDRVREEFIKDAILRSLGLTVSQGTFSATCGVQAQTQKLIKSDPALFLKQMTELADKGQFTEPGSGRVIKARAEFLKSDSSESSSQTSSGRLIAGRLWELSNLEADNGSSFSVVADKIGDVDGYSQGNGNGKIPDILTGQPHHWVVNSYRARFGQDYSGVYTHTENGEIAPQVQKALKTGSAKGEVAIINIQGGQGAHECHVVLIDEIKDGRITFRDSRLEVVSGRESAALNKLPPGARLEGRSTWSVSIDAAIGGEPPILDLVMLKGEGKAMSALEDRSLQRYYAAAKTSADTFEPAKVAHFNPTLFSLSNPHTGQDSSLATGKVGFGSIKKPVK